MGNRILDDLNGPTIDLFGASKVSNKREPIPSSFKNELLVRQKYKCNICKKILDLRSTDVDHIKGIAEGGKTTLSNLQAICKNCHGAKTH